MRSEKKNQKGLEINVVAFFKELSKKLWIVLIVALIGITMMFVDETTLTEILLSTVPKSTFGVHFSTIAFFITRLERMYLKVPAILI